MEVDFLESLFERLLADSELMSLVSDVVQIGAEQGAAYPLLVVSDLASRVAYTSGGIDTERHFINIEAIALPTEEHSARTNARLALKRVRELLQDIDEALLTDEGEVICLRRLGAMASSLIVQNSDEMYVRIGDEWELIVGQD